MMRDIVAEGRRALRQVGPVVGLIGAVWLVDGTRRHASLREASEERDLVCDPLMVYVV